MLGLSVNLNYDLFNGNVDLRKGIFRLCRNFTPTAAVNTPRYCPGHTSTSAYPKGIS